jgi:hypothetical protein
MGVGMSRLFEDFLSNKWNVYGLQVLASSLMIMILHQYITIFQLCIIGLCTFIISFCQRLLGIKFGMLFYEANQDRLGGLLDEIRKLNERKKDE